MEQERLQKYMARSGVASRRHSEELIKEVLKDFRHKNDVQEAFKENLDVNKESNEELVKRTEDILFTTFSKSIADSVLISPKYITTIYEQNYL